MDSTPLLIPVVLRGHTNQKRILLESILNLKLEFVKVYIFSNINNLINITDINMKLCMNVGMTLFQSHAKFDICGTFIKWGKLI